MANINVFIKDTKIYNLAFYYARAYLLQKNVVLSDSAEPVIDRKWYFGYLNNLKGPGSYLIKTEDNCLLTFLVLRYLVPDQISQDTNIALHNILLHLLVNRYETFPAEKLRIAHALNHANIHFTLMLVEFEIDPFQYRQLYNAFHQEFSNKNIDELYKEMADPNSRIQQLLKNTPVSKKPLLLKHYDSLGGESYVQRAKEDSKLLLSNNAIWSIEQCEQQKGMTCGDWTIFNAFYFGVFTQKPNIPSSEALRDLLETPTIAKASALLFAQNIQSEAIAKHPLQPNIRSKTPSNLYALSRYIIGVGLVGPIIGLLTYLLNVKALLCAGAALGIMLFSFPTIGWLPIISISLLCHAAIVLDQTWRSPCKSKQQISGTSASDTTEAEAIKFIDTQAFEKPILNAVLHGFKAANQVAGKNNEPYGKKAWKLCEKIEKSTSCWMPRISRST
ncbi:MAG: hypothetical protein JSS07_00715 [Proteobacteria bacterium]|nr:hypothetical protein [Pseudomonadota bacterium]